MPSFIEDITNQVVELVGAGMGFVDDEVAGDVTKSILKKLRKNYATMSLEETLQIWDSMGHRSDETPPCKVCKEIAKQEFKLSEGE